MKKLAGKRVLITGGARGIGLAIGRRFAAEGSEVIVTDVDEGALPKAEEVIRAAGGRARSYRMDVTSPDDVAAVRSRLAADAGPPDIVVNNAGVVFGGAFAETPLERHRLTYEVNVMGSVTVAHAFLPDLVERPRAHLVQIASASGFIGLPYGSTYASSKWAAIGLAESLRLELEQEGHRHVGVTIVCPSYVDTGLFEGARPPRTTTMVKPDELADRVVKAVRKGDVWVLTPWLVNITPATRALLPGAVFDKVSWALGVTSSMKHWKGHGERAEGGEEADR